MRIVLFCVIALSFGVIGCGSRHLDAPATDATRPQGGFGSAVAVLCDSLVQEVFSENSQYKIVLLLSPANGGAPQYQFEGELRAAFKSVVQGRAAKTAQSIRLIAADLVSQNVAGNGLSTNPAGVSREWQQWRALGATQVVTIQWTLQGDNISLDIRAIDTRTDGRNLFATTKEFGRTDEIRRMLGEHLPGTFVVESGSRDANLIWDSEDKGPIPHDGLSFKAEYGEHNVVVHKEGYKDFSKTVFIAEQTTERLDVKFSRASGAPLAGLITSAVLPGGGAVLYGKELGARASVAINTLSAATFYVVGSIAVGDILANLNKKSVYISGEAHKDFKKLQTVELGILAASWAVNVISGMFVGADYLSYSKRGEEVSHVTPNASTDPTLSTEPAHAFRILRLTF